MARITPEERQQNLNKFLSISKVRNGAGDPVVLYHVTPKDFSTFKAGGHDPEISGPATWLTPHKGHYPAWHNVGGDNGDFKPGTNVMPVHANITSPLVLDTPEMLDWARHVYANKSIDFPHYIHPETKAQLVEDGYDGIFFAGFHGKRHSTVPYDNIGIGEQPHKDEEIIALHPETQLKSAIGNNGDFDPSIPDVTKAEGGEVDEPGITAYHGSPHDFPRFDMSKIGTGEGNQTFGHGLYFAEHEPVATGYRDKLSEGTYKTDSGEIFDPYKNLEHMNVRVAAYKGIDPAIERATGLLQDNPNDDRLHRDLEKLHAMKAQNAAPHKGHMYEVHINAHPDHFLDWDTPLRENPSSFHAIAEHFGGLNKIMGEKTAIESELTERLAGNAPSAATKHLSDMDLIDHPSHRLGELYEAMTKPKNSFGYDAGAKATGEKLYHALSVITGSDKSASELLLNKGIKGVQYYDAGSRNSNDKKTRNYVVFDDKLVNVKRKYARGGTVQKAKGGYIGHDDPRRMKNFQHWFGKSTAIDSEGKPWAHYHVTAKNFSKFIPGGQNPDVSGPAIWLTPNKKSQPAGHNVIDEKGQFKEGANVMPLYVRIEKPLHVDDSDPEGKEQLRQKFGSKSYAWPMTLHPDDVNKMKAAGYDGIFHMKHSHEEQFNPETGEGLETIVFHGSQLKSATGNDGGFRRDEEDINKARGGSIVQRALMLTSKKA